MSAAFLHAGYFLIPFAEYLALIPLKEWAFLDTQPGQFPGIYKGLHQPFASLTCADDNDKSAKPIQTGKELQLVAGKYNAL